MSRIILASLVALVAAGCSGGADDKWSANRPKTAPVSGVVTYKGAPVEGANVSLTPKSGSGQGGFALTDKDGKFQVSTFDQNDGAVPGEYSVMISKKTVDTTPNPKDPNGPPLKSVEKSHIPAKYSSIKGGLSTTVTEAGPNELKFDLVD